VATLTIAVPDELAEEFNRLFADVDQGALVTALLVDLLDRIRRFPCAGQAVADNPDLPIGFVLDLLEAKAEGRQIAERLLPGTRQA
jgi:hypothetical protein